MSDSEEEVLQRAGSGDEGQASAKRKRVPRVSRVPVYSGALSEDESDEDVADMYSAKLRFRLQSMQATGMDAEDDDEGDDDDDDDDEGDSDAEEAAAVHAALAEGGPLSDLLPIGGDAAKGFRCKHCTGKVMHSNTDVTQHLASGAHKKRMRMARMTALSAREFEELVATKKERNARKRLKRREKQAPLLEKKKIAAKAAFKLKSKQKTEALTDEQIAARKAKFQAKKLRRQQRKADAAATATVQAE